MKKALLFFAISLVVMTLFSEECRAGLSKVNTIRVTPTVTAINGYYKWRKDADSFDNSNWISSSSIPTLKNGALSTVVSLDPIDAGVVYRIRMGGNFQVSLVGNADYTTTIGTTGNTGNQTIHIYDFKLLQTPSYTAYYREGDCRNTTIYPDPTSISTLGWSVVPTSDDGVAPFYMSQTSNTNSSEVYDGATFDAIEEAGTYMQVLPTTKSSTSYESDGRPTNPYFYLGGGYYDTYNPGTISSFGYKFGTTINITNRYPNGAGGYQNLTAPSDVLKMGAEIETGVKFTKKMKKNTTYTFLLSVSVPYSGHGTFNNYESYGQYEATPTTPATTTIRGAFKSLSSVLPVELSSFTGVNNNGIPTLSWTTANEINNTGFYVQRSSDNKTFSDVHFEPTKASNGNSSSALDYTYPDASASKGLWYYRLKQVDKDGATDYSKVVSIDLNASTTEIAIGPNPVTSSLTIKNAETGSSYAIYSMTGQTLNTGTITSSSSFIINVPNLPSGTYILKIVGKSGKQTSKKFIRS